MTEPTPVPNPPPPPGERVQSTATGELLAKLATAPKLDGQRFSLEGEVGKGGMGAVLKIHDRFLNRRLAMKVLLERAAPRDDEEKRLANQLLGRFLEEAQVTSQLDHPGVVPVHELGLDASGKVYFTMRLVKGRTASEVFADAFAGVGEWTLTRALEVVLKVCDTMAYAHDKGVLHRDLKPSNVMVGRFGEVYVMDWGLAKVTGQADRHDLRIKKDAGTGVSRIESARKHDAESDTASSVVSMDGQQLGTPSYMPPEQARSEDVDARADVYAIGAMMYELLTGRAPYTTPGVRQPAYRILNDVVDGPPKRIEQLRKGVPAELVAIVEKAMARDRAARFASVADLANDLRAFLAQRVVKAYRTGALVEMRLWVRRNKALAASLLLGVVATGTYAQKASSQARENRLLALRESAERRRFENKVREFDHLALVVTCRQLMKSVDTLTPGWPDQQAALDAWTRDAEQLLAQRDDIRGTVAALEERRRHFIDRAAGFLATSLQELLVELPRVEAVLPEIEKRQRWARCVGSLTKAHPNTKVSWQEARAAIAKADGVVASELYRGQDIPLRDEDVWGLVPIGMNPQSKLWEFYDLRSAWDGVQDPAALPIPSHGTDGQLTVAGDNGIVFVLLPGGFLPLLPRSTPADERRCAIRLDPFFVGKHEVTQGQWLRWTGTNPSKSRDLENAALPVESVSWKDANRTLEGVGLILPSDLQWEYALRAGTKTAWWTGNQAAGIREAENLDADAKLLRVGSRKSNPFGLFDMGGNVQEWCWDEYTHFSSGKERAGDGRLPEGEGYLRNRILRGSAFGGSTDAAQGRSRNTGFDVRNDSDSGRIGLRAARALLR